MEDFNKNEILLLSRSDEQTIPVPAISLGSPRSSQTPSSRSSADDASPQTRVSSRVPAFPKFNTSDAQLFANVTAARGTAVDDKAGPTAGTMDESKEGYVTHGGTRSPIPTLDKVLSRDSETPLSQYNFYAYLREEWAAEENLTFWLDVSKHESLFRSWQENDKRKRASKGHGHLEREAIERSHLQQQESRRSSGTASSSASHRYKDSTSSADTSSPTLSSDSRSHAISVSTTPTISANDIVEEELSQDQPLAQRDVVNRRVTEEELTRSAKRIYRKYAQLNIFPVENQRTMQDLVERQGRFNPVVFSGPKAYVYHIMQVIYFPKFVHAATDMNLTSLHAIIALPLGIIALASGIALMLYYVFTGRHDRWIRLWGLIPIWFGWVLLQTSATRFLPPLVIFGLSEHKIFRFHKIREPAILSAHRKRALAYVGWDTLFAAMTLGVLMAIPSIPLTDDE